MDCPHILSTINNASMNIRVQVFEWTKRDLVNSD